MIQPVVVVTQGHNLAHGFVEPQTTGLGPSMQLVQTSPLFFSSENSSFQFFFFFLWEGTTFFIQAIVIAPVWGNCQNKHTQSPCCPELEVYLNPQDGTQVSGFRRYLFSRLVNGLVYYTRPAVCNSVLLRGKELWFWSKSNSWWGLELHNLALQSKQMGAYSVLIRLSVILIPFSSVTWVLWTCCDWLETDYSASNPWSTPVVWKVC